jgi:hypothetical protein
MIGVELPVPQVNDLVDSLLRLFPFILSEVTERFESLMPVMTSLPFVGALLLGSWAGFKIALGPGKDIKSPFL